MWFDLDETVDITAAHHETCECGHVRDEHTLQRGNHRDCTATLPEDIDVSSTQEAMHEILLETGKFEVIAYALHLIDAEMANPSVDQDWLDEMAADPSVEPEPPGAPTMREAQESYMRHELSALRRYLASDHFRNNWQRTKDYT